jgi:hypothetical protein
VWTIITIRMVRLGGGEILPLRRLWQAPAAPHSNSAIAPTCPTNKCSVLLLRNNNHNTANFSHWAGVIEA